MSAANNKKEANIKWFRDQLDRLARDRLMHGKYVVIHGEQIVASYDTFDSALREAVRSFPPDEFAIQQVVEDDEVVHFIRLAM